MDNSNSGIISTEFVNVSDSFSDYTDISRNNHNRLVKAQRFGKWYMLKGLNAKYAEKAVFVELLRKEFDLGISLDHPNIIRTIGKETDSYLGDCIILEYIDGVTLREWLKTHPLKSERRRVVMQLLDAMSYFQTKGIIHRDLKPENILITRNGANVKVIDFGLSDSDEYAILKQPAGSRKYASPEQLENDKEVDLRADIYAFGIILSEFGLSGVYKRISKKAQKKDPCDRYANVAQIISAVRSSHNLHVAEVVILAVILVSIGFYGLVSSIASHERPDSMAATDTVVREVLRDTIRITTEIPVVVEKVVEKVVLKDIGESDSTYIARKKWENEIKQRIKAEYKRLYTPIVEKYRKAQTMEDIDMMRSDDEELSGHISKFINEMMNELDPDNEFYSEMIHNLASAGLRYTNEIANKKMEIIKKTDPTKQ